MWKAGQIVTLKGKRRKWICRIGILTSTNISCKNCALWYADDLCAKYCCKLPSLRHIFRLIKKVT